MPSSLLTYPIYGVTQVISAPCHYCGIALGMSEEGFKAVVAAYELEWQNMSDILQCEILHWAAPVSYFSSNMILVHSWSWSLQIQQLEEESERLQAQVGCSQPTYISFVDRTCLCQPDRKLKMLAFMKQW
jgi:hypothetical protein